MIKAENPYVDRAIHEFRKRLSGVEGSGDVLDSIDAFENSGTLPPEVDPRVLAAASHGRVFGLQLFGLPIEETAAEEAEQALEFFPILNWEESDVLQITVIANWTPRDLDKAEAILRDWLIARLV